MKEIIQAVKKLIRDIYDDFFDILRASRLIPIKNQLVIEGVMLELDYPTISRRMKLQLNQGYELAEIRLISSYVKQNDAVLEIGAGIGFIGIYLSKIVGVSNYLGVEANPELMTIIQKNAALNGCDIEVRNVALANNTGAVKFNRAEDFWSSSLVDRGDVATDEQEVLSISSASLLAEIQFIPSVLIIDIEGFERDIDFSFLGTEGISKIIIELHPHVIGAINCCSVLMSIIDKGFTLIDCDDNCYVLVRK